MTAPLIIISGVLNMWQHIIMILFLLVFYKLFFKYNFHAVGKHGKLICLAFTYGIPLLFLGLLNNFKDQYFLLMLLCLATTYIFSHIARIIHAKNLFNKKNTLYKAQIHAITHEKPFCIETCTEEELRERCRIKKFKPNDIDEAVKHFILHLPHEEIDPIRPKTSETRRRRWKQKLIK